MDTSSKSATSSRNTTTELDKFQLFYELVPVPKNPGRIKRSKSSHDK